MPANGILSWNNESEGTPYPLERTLGVDSLIVDANFVQFDAFQPILLSTTVADDQFTFRIQFDRTIKTINISKFLLTGVTYTSTIYDGARYLGTLVLGADAVALYDELVNKTFNTNIKFLANTVKSIPSNAGVYSLNGFTGIVVLETDDFSWYETAGNEITINAVYVPSPTDENFLKTLNLVTPVDNNVHIKDSETVKISMLGPSAIQISLVGTSAANLIMEQNNTIPTNPNP